MNLADLVEHGEAFLFKFLKMLGRKHAHEFIVTVIAQHAAYPSIWRRRIASTSLAAFAYSSCTYCISSSRLSIIA